MPRPETDGARARRTFVPLADYAPPALPTDESLRHALRRARDRLFGADAPDPTIAEDRLDRTGAATLDRIAAPPAWGPVLDEMTETFAPWLAAGDGARLRLVVLPPCDNDGLVAAWAARAGLPTLDAPPREALLRAASLPDLDGQGVLVIPRLEDWVLRHREGLGAVRLLLQTLADGDRRVLLGCDAQAWAFLSRSVGAATLLPAPLTPRPFDAGRLRDWFAGLAAAAPDHVARFRLSTTGEDVLALDGDGRPESDFLRILAARARGISWVAWSLWRDALRDTPDDGEGKADATLPVRDDDRTLWIASLRDPALPRGAERDALAVLHALLIHGPLSPAMLRETLPLVGGTTVLPALVEAGIVARADGRLRCLPAAYPAVRQALADAGHPLGAI